MLRFSAILSAMLLLTIHTYAQKSSRHSAVIAFYNLENLCDTIDDPATNDEEFLPTSARLWNSDKYQRKLQNLSTVISQIGSDEGLTPPAIIGLVELENKAVLSDLIAQPALKKYNYGIVHYNSPDKRGMDVALLYRSDYMKVTNSQSYPVVIYSDNDNSRIFTRDILVVTGKLKGQTVNIIVNHWPSRRGNDDSNHLRTSVAMRCRSLVDSLTRTDATANVIVMGDFNDDPTNESIVQNLQAVDKASLKPGYLFNAMTSLYTDGQGTLKYNDKWNLFDQIIITQSLLSSQHKGYSYQSAHIFSRPYLFQQDGDFKGYPNRTYGGKKYLGGYSDHLPVYMILEKR